MVSADKSDVGMSTFISHNAADKDTARALATMLVEQGENVWFDEWEIRPGQSIVGGIEAGLEGAASFVLLWSEAAQRSNWVGAEVRAIIRRRIDDGDLRIIPLMVDNTALPALVADYRGFNLAGGVTLDEVVREMTGRPRDIEVAQRLQARLHELTGQNIDPRDPFGVIICPTCGSDQLDRTTSIDHKRDDLYYIIECQGCGWGDWTQ